MPQAPWAASAVEARAVAALLPYAGNARTHSAEQVAQIAASILEFGFAAPVLVDERGEIIAGHGRLMAAKSLGLDTVPTIVRTGLTEAQKAAYRLADNRIALNAGWDEALLAAEVAKLQEMGGVDLALTGFDGGEIERLLAGLETDAGNLPAPAVASGAEPAPGNQPDADGEDPADAAPEPPRQAVARVGDIWLLGEHRLACGDSTNPATVARVMATDRAALLFTSPPYGNQRDYTTGGVSDWDALMQGVFAHLDGALRRDAQVLVNLGLIHREGEWQPYWQGWLDWMRVQGWRRFGLYAWDQGPGLPGDWNGRLAPAFELVFHFNREARRPNKIIPCRWAGHVNSEKGGLRAKDGTVGEWQHAGQGVQETRIPDSVLRINRSPAIVGGLKPRIRLRIPLRGSGAAATAPEWGRLLRCCTMAEGITAAAIGAPTAATAGTTTTLTLATPFAATAQLYRGMPLLLSGDRTLTTGITDYTAARVATLGETMATAGTVTTLAQIPPHVLYSPTSDEAVYRTATLYFYADGLRWRFTGAVGTWSLELSTGGIGFLVFELRAQMLDKAAAALPTGWNTAIRPTPPRFVGGRCQLNQQVARARRVMLEAGVSVTLPDNPEATEGYDPAVPVERDARGAIDPLMNTTTAVALFNAFRQGTAMSLMAILGATAGNRFCVIAPAAKATGMRPGERDGLGQLDIAFQLDGADSPLFLAQF
jgi:ParB-like chromosome segregation protein Spo0J